MWRLWCCLPETHAGHGYHLTGPKAVTFYEVADLPPVVDREVHPVTGDAERLDLQLVGHAAPAADGIRAVINVAAAIATTNRKLHLFDRVRR
ncbi:MAG: hypothetical protein ACR2OH_08355 [Microthrixaceae bacterium]